uniref:Uncharacterized protein n=1 Tax=Solanum lycopersicum TaxID=4081 RepID=K4D6D8_SOLLC
MENTVPISTTAPSNSSTGNRRSQPRYLYCSCFRRCCRCDYSMSLW